MAAMSSRMWRSLKSNTWGLRGEEVCVCVRVRVPVRVCVCVCKQVDCMLASMHSEHAGNDPSRVAEVRGVECVCLGGGC